MPVTSVNLGVSASPVYHIISSFISVYASKKISRFFISENSSIIVKLILVITQTVRRMESNHDLKRSHVKKKKCINKC